MKRKRLTWVPVLACMAALTAWSGCSSEKSPVSTGGPGTNDPADQTVNLDDPHGGYLAVGEEPAFGDENLAAAGSNEEEVADGLAGLDAGERVLAEDIEGAPSACYSVTLLWGKLDTRLADIPGTHEVPGDPVVWSGRLWVNDGVIRVMRLLGFEKPEDHLIDPRPSPAALEWVSVTHGDYDGLHAIVALRASSELSPGEVPDDSLHFRAGPLGEVAFPFADLEDLNLILDVPESQEQVALTVVRIDVTPAVRGFLSGTWGWAEGDSVGRFAGRWIAANGRTQGHLHGIYGINSRDEQVFFGKYIDDQGSFQGFLRGTYKIVRRVGNPDDPGGARVNYEVGEFHGRWEDARGDWLGALQGTWSRVGRKPGVFSGSWRGLGITP